MRERRKISWLFYARQFLERMEKKGIAFFGGRSEMDILLVREFEELGWDVRPTTDDGSLGTRGLVTDAFDPWAQERGAGNRERRVFSIMGRRRPQADGLCRRFWPPPRSRRACPDDSRTSRRLRPQV